MTARGRWSGRLTPRHVQRRLARHVNRFVRGEEDRWSMDRLTAAERDQVQRCYLSLVMFYKNREAELPPVRAMRALCRRFGLRCEAHISRCSHGTCRVCGHHPADPGVFEFYPPDAGICP